MSVPGRYGVVDAGTEWRVVDKRMHTVLSVHTSREAAWRETTKLSSSIASTERHDYERSCERPHQMQTDPPCNVCGAAKRHPNHKGE